MNLEEFVSQSCLIVRSKGKVQIPCKWLSAGKNGVFHNVMLILPQESCR